MVAVIASCGSGDNVNDNTICDCNNKVNAIEITDSEGTVYFDGNIQKWYISTHTEGTYDEVQLFIPCNMKEEYKEAKNKKVLFSGTAFDLLSGLSNVPAGSTYRCIEILAFDLSQK
jgi:hypothetical protein